MPASLDHVFVDGLLLHVSNWVGMPRQRRPSGAHAASTAFCPECGEKVTLVYPTKAAHHARHLPVPEGATPPTCHGTVESQVHLQAKADVVRLVGNWLPTSSMLEVQTPCRALPTGSGRACLDPAWDTLGTLGPTATIKAYPTRHRSKPDLVLTTANGIRIAIEVEHSSAISRQKQERLSADFDHWLTLSASSAGSRVLLEGDRVVLLPDTLAPERHCTPCIARQTQEIRCAAATRSWAFDVQFRTGAPATRRIFEVRMEWNAASQVAQWELTNWTRPQAPSSLTGRRIAPDVAEAMRAADAAVRRLGPKVNDTILAVHPLGQRSTRDWSDVPASFTDSIPKTDGRQLGFLK